MTFTSVRSDSKYRSLPDMSRGYAQRGLAGVCSVGKGGLPIAGSSAAPILDLSKVESQVGTDDFHPVAATSESFIERHRATGDEAVV